MARHHQPVTIAVRPPDGRYLVSTGGRFQQGLHVIVSRDTVTAWIPEGGRTASGPPRFTGRIDREAGQTAVSGAIWEPRIDQFNALLWGSLAVAALGIAVGGTVAEHQHKHSALLPLLTGLVLASLFALFSMSSRRGRAKTFNTKAGQLEYSLNGWASPQAESAR